MKLPRSRFLLIPLAAMIAPSTCPGQDPDLPFDSGSTGADGDLVLPPQVGQDGRYYASSAFDTTSNRVVIVGGETAASGYGIANTFSWDGVSAGTLPTPIANPSFNTPWGGHLAFDEARNRLVYCGGNWSGSTYSHTFVFDGTAWINTGQNGPHDTALGVFEYDPIREECVIFGGTSNALSKPDARNHTHVWTGTSWIAKSPATSPPSRWGSDGAFDAQSERLIIFGGMQENGNPLGDTWVWDGTNWAELNPATSPSSRSGHSIVYDSQRNEVLLFGGRAGDGTSLNDTWIWKNGNWTEASPSNSPSPRQNHELAYDSTRQQAVLFGGQGGGYRNDLWEWDGSDWTKVRENSSVVIDMADHPDGIYHYNRIEIPSGITVSFKKNAANTPVVWLAQDNVVIDGVVDLNGQDSHGTPDPANAAQGGPGGFAGGLGGWNFNTSGSYAGTPGLGPGGGNPGLTSAAYGENGRYDYGNAYIQPLIGGSGGGGQGATATANGTNGSGGGGAILIASSREVIVNGEITCRGGRANQSTKGMGSGGAIRIAADYFRGSGVLDCRPYSASSGNSGRVRIEAFMRPFFSSGGLSQTSPSVSAPLDNFSVALEPRADLLITSVNGQTVAQPPGGDLSNPDVIFEESGPVAITVTAVNIPDGTPVHCRIATNGQIITLPAGGQPEVTLAGGSATFNTVLPAGRGSIQASSIFTR